MLLYNTQARHIESERNEENQQGFSSLTCGGLRACIEESSTTEKKPNVFFSAPKHIFFDKWEKAMLYAKIETL